MPNRFNQLILYFKSTISLLTLWEKKTSSTVTQETVDQPGHEDTGKTSVSTVITAVYYYAQERCKIVKVAWQITSEQIANFRSTLYNENH